MTSSSKTNSPNYKRKTLHWAVKSPTYVNLTSFSKEHPNERKPSPSPRGKSFSLPNAPSKSTSSRSTYQITSSSSCESPTVTHVAPPPKLRFAIPMKLEPQELPPQILSHHDPYVSTMDNWPSGPSNPSPSQRVSQPPPRFKHPPPPHFSHPPPRFELLGTQKCRSLPLIKFVSSLIRDPTILFNTFDQYLIDELFEVQNVFHQMEQAVEQHRLESKTFEVKMNQVLNENELLLEQVIDKDIVNIIMNFTIDIASMNMHEYEKCLKLEIGLLNKKDFVEKKIYDKLFKSFTTLEEHCIFLEVDSQINQEIFQRDNSVSNQNAPSFDQLFELNKLKAQS
ncbi:hypothetical protein Tco_0882149 [Tanacetum coccineum]